jgi:hypothetical protein
VALQIDRIGPITNPADPACAATVCAPSCGVGAIQRAQRSSRWLGWGQLALLFAYASFGRFDSDGSVPRITTGFPRCRGLAFSAFDARAPLVRFFGHRRLLTPRAFDGWRSLYRNPFRPLTFSVALRAPPVVGSSRSAAFLPDGPRFREECRDDVIDPFGQDHL